MSGEYLNWYELTRMRVPGREAGLIPEKLIVLGENRRISGSPLGWSQPKVYPSIKNPVTMPFG